MLLLGRKSATYVIHLDQQRGLARLGAARAMVALGLSIGNMLACGVQAPKGRYSLRELAQKGEKVGV